MHIKVHAECTPLVILWKKCFKHGIVVLKYLCILLDIFHRIKNTFIISTDAHYYKNYRMLEQFKIITLAPTCFSSCRSHHQGAVLCLARTTEKPYSVVLAKHRTAPWWWVLREPKHVGASVIILNCFNILWFL